MKFMLSLLAFGYVGLAHPAPSLPLHPGGIGGFFKGPNSETIIKGPDGSVITATAEGGEVQTKLEPIVVAQPVVIPEVVPIAAAPVIEAVAVPAPVVESKQSSELIGPSGRIATQGSQSVIAGPASTTVTGPAVLAETVVKGPPIVGVPVINGAVGISAVPTAVTAAAIPNIASIAVTASPVTAVPISSIVTSRAPIIFSSPNVATVTATPPVVTVTAAPQAVATASAASLASASADAAAALNEAAAVAISTAGGALTPQVIQDQLAIDNTQLNLNPALIPAVNIIPPEIPVTPRLPVGRLGPTPGPLLGVGPTPGTLLTTPGLGAVGTGTNIQREEQDALTVTPTIPQVTPQATLTPQQIAALQSQQALLNSQIRQTQTSVPSNIQREEASAGVTPNGLQITPQVTLTQEQISALQNQQILLNNQIQQAQQAAGTLIPSPTPASQPLFTPNTDNTNVVTLANLAQQNLLSAELAKSGIDASAVQLTNVPLSAVSSLGVGGLKGAINDGLTAEAWGRFSRDAEAGKKAGEKRKNN